MLSCSALRTCVRLYEMFAALHGSGGPQDEPSHVRPNRHLLCVMIDRVSRMSYPVTINLTRVFSPPSPLSYFPGKTSACLSK